MGPGTGSGRRTTSPPWPKHSAHESRVLLARWRKIASARCLDVAWGIADQHGLLTAKVDAVVYLCELAGFLDQMTALAGRVAEGADREVLPDTGRL